MAEPSVISVGERDNVVIAARRLSPGAVVVSRGTTNLTVTDEIPFGHKVAVALIRDGEAVVKYDEVIGVATTDIPAGSHVHVHNVASARLPGSLGVQRAATP